MLNGLNFQLLDIEITLVGNEIYSKLRLQVHYLNKKPNVVDY